MRVVVTAPLPASFVAHVQVLPARLWGWSGLPADLARRQQCYPE